MTERENRIRAYRFQGPEWIPIYCHINGACWERYGAGAVDNLMTSHQILFPGHQKGSGRPRSDDFPGWARKGRPFTDSWGCVWESVEDGITGVVTENPLADWSRLEGFHPPDPNTHNHLEAASWDKYVEWIGDARTRGEFVDVALQHGHTFLRLEYLRGYENLIEDMFAGEPRLDTLVEMVEKFNAGLVARLLELKPDIMGFPEDLGGQDGPLVMPDHFRRYIKPSYGRLMAPVRKAGILVHMHCDGHIMTILDDVLECGVNVLNLQDLVNGIDNIAKRLKSRAAIELDVDRQNVTVRGSPKDIDDLIHEETSKLGSPKGGLALKYGLYPGTPLVNARAVLDAMEKYSRFYS